MTSSEHSRGHEPIRGSRQTCSPWSPIRPTTWKSGDPSSARPVPLGLADTSLFIAQERAHPLGGQPPERVAVSVITVGELRLGVLAAATTDTRALRLETLTMAQLLDPLTIDGSVANAWAVLRLALRDAHRRMPLNDSWIAATAIAHGIPVVSQDADYDDVPGLEVVRV